MTRRAWLAFVVCALIGGPRLTAQIRVGPGAPMVVGPEAVVIREGPAAARGRSVPVGTSVITGRVIAAATQLPVAGVRVGISGGADPAGPGRSAMASGVPSTRALSRAAVTDDDGRFVFEGLPAGEFMLSASRNGFLPLNYGATKPDRPGTPIRIEAGQRLDLSMRLRRGGAVAGMITGPEGLPQFQAQVRALRLTTTNGQRRLLPMGSATTDDRGAYRLFNLRPGEYLIAATPGSADVTNAERTRAEAALFDDALARARAESSVLPPAVFVAPRPTTPGSEPAGYAPVYFPGTSTLSSAHFLTIDADAERLGVDFTAGHVRASHVVGTVMGLPSLSGPVTISQENGFTRTETTRVQITVFGDDEARDLGQIAGVQADEHGKFTIRNLAPGRYTVLAQIATFTAQVVRTVATRAGGESVTVEARVGDSGPPPDPPPAPPPLWGRATVDVDGHGTPEIAITLQPARTISGRVVHETAAPAGGAHPPVQVTAVGALDAPQNYNGRVPQARTEADGRFTLTGVVPGRYMLRASGQAKSALVHGVDALDVPFDVDGDRDITNVVITMSDRLAEVSGTVTGSSGQPAADYTVVIAPSDRRYWQPGARRIQFSRPSSAGRYVFRALPAGDYLVAAVTDVEPGGQYDPDFLKAMAGAAVRVTVLEGGRHVQDIRLAR